MLCDADEPVTAVQSSAVRFVGDLQPGLVGAVHICPGLVGVFQPELVGDLQPGLVGGVHISAGVVGTELLGLVSGDLHSSVGVVAGNVTLAGRLGRGADRGSGAAINPASDSTDAVHIAPGAVGATGPGLVGGGACVSTVFAVDIVPGPSSARSVPPTHCFNSSHAAMAPSLDSVP